MDKRALNDILMLVIALDFQEVVKQMKKDFRNLLKKVFLVSVVLLLGLLLGMFARNWRGKEDKKNIVVWNMGEGWGRGEEFEQYYNELLEKYGANCQVKFEKTELNDEVYQKGGFTDLCTDEFFQAYDIITLPTDTLYSDYYNYYGIQGYFLELDDWLKTELGKQLYYSFPEKAWRAWQINGNSLGVGNLVLNRNMYLIVNTTCMDKHGIKKRPESLEDWLEISGQIKEEEIEAGNQDFVGMLPYSFTWYPNAEYLQVMGGVVFVEKEGLIQGESLFHSDTYLSYLRLFYEQWKDGNLKYNLDELGKGNFFAMIYPGYSEESVEMMVQNTISSLEEVELKAIHLKDWDIPFRGIAKKTVISNQTEKPEEAFEILALSFSEPELMNALVYGIENQDYILKEGKVVPLSGNMLQYYIRSYGNSMQLLPLYNEPENRKELLQEQILEERDSLALGFVFDPRKVQRQWDGVTNILIEHIAIQEGISDDIETEIATIQYELENAGIRDVLDELNQQLIDWQERRE